MSPRKAIFWLHLSAGTTAGIVVLVMSVTGVLLAYERVVTAWAERDVRTVGASGGGARLSVEQLVAVAGKASPTAPPIAITLWADPSAAAAVSFGRESVVYVNPYTGEVTGEGSRRARGFFRVVTDWHRWLGAQDTRRPFARGVTGACNLAFLVLILTGPILWCPRKWSWRQLRPVVLFQRRLTGRARDFNWHNVIGVWSAAPLMVIVSCAVVMSYPWANDLLYRVAGEPPPATRGAAAEARRAPAPPGLAGIDPLWARAEQQVLGWRSITLRLPSSADAPVTFTIDRGDGGRPQLRSQLTLARATGAVVRFEPFDSLGRGRRLRTWVRWAHTGEAGGLAGQTVAFLASAGASVLVCTGLALACRRLLGWVGRRSPKASNEPVSRRLDENSASPPA